MSRLAALVSLAALLVAPILGCGATTFEPITSGTASGSGGDGGTPASSSSGQGGSAGSERCDDASCDKPDDPVCLSATTLRTSTAPGKCEGNACHYPHLDVACPSGCSDGACVSPGASAVALGDHHACALLAGGRVRCWGGNADGQLGDGTTTDRSSPVDVVGLGSGVVSISVGSVHSCALTAAGTVKCWGSNALGRLGNGSGVDSAVPVDVPGLGAGVSAVSAGWTHSCAVTASGALRCWGSNEDGELGDGSTTDSATPVAVAGIASGIVAVTTGERHTCALDSSGAVRCWGQDGVGQLGTPPPRMSSSVPVDVPALRSGVVAIDAEYDHTCAATSSGDVWCWGFNNRGQIGDETTTDALSPWKVAGISRVTAIAAGAGNTFVATATGVSSWGDGTDGRLGNGAVDNSLTPVQVTGLSAGTRALDASAEATCAVTADRFVKCWGTNDHGQLGDGTLENRSVPVFVLAL